METVFLDTHFLLARINSRDQWHHAARRLDARPEKKFVTTAWVMVEFADALCAAATRHLAAQFLSAMAEDNSIEIVPPTWEFLQRGLALYEQRRDKNWSLTDCLSFVTMTERGLTAAATADHHFEQAGFKALLRAGTN